MRFPAVWLGVFLSLAIPARAQMPRVEGTITQSGDGVPLQARLFFQPPDSLKIEVLNGQGEVSQTVVASENQTQTFDVRSKRLGVIGANIVREWFRGAGILAGGPANFAFSGATGFVAQPTQGVTRVRDTVLLGSEEQRTFYVVSKVPVRAFPARIDIQNGVRTDIDDAKNPLLRAQISFNAQKLPLRAVVGSGADATTFDYVLRTRADEFPANTFALPEAAKDAIREEDTLRAPSSYGDTSPDELWNHGAALWRATGDSGGALALWARATLANPRSTAPRFSSLEVNLATRAVTGATRALDGLKPLLSSPDFAWAATGVDELRGDRAAFLRDLQLAATSGEPERQLALSLALRASGDIKGAREAWKALLSPQTPRAIAIRAAENLAVSSSKAELSTLSATLEGDGEAVQLAKALLDLRGGKIPATTFSALPFRASFARALERAGHAETARPLWEAMEKSDIVVVQNEARAHLVTILARAGEASAALAVWNRWNATLVFDKQKEAAQNILFDAFQKAGKTDALRVLLLNRASGTGAKDQDLRLGLAFQLAFGNDESIAAAQTAGYARFPGVPFWQGKRAETLVEQAFLLAPIDNFGFRRRSAMFKEANGLLDKAIAGASDPTFYTLQKALVNIQHATETGGVVDSVEMSNADAAARALLAKLDASGDADALTVATLGWNAFPSSEDRLKSLASARRALDTAPIDGDRSTLVFAVRQSAARLFEKASDVNSATREWTALLDVAHSAEDEAALVAVLFHAHDKRKDAVGMAQLLVRVGGEHWPLDPNAGLLSGAAARVVVSPMLPEVVKNLDALADAPANNNATKSAVVARAALALARLARAKEIIAIPGAPPTADAELERATRAFTPAFAALQNLSETGEAFWATRARLLLIDANTLSPEAKHEVLQKLVASQGSEPSLVLTLLDAGANPQSRAQAAQTLDFRLQTWRQLALDALEGGDKENADFWSREAFEFASSAPEVSANEFQSIAFARARIAWEVGQIPSATALYNSLASAGWNPVGRGAALLALFKRLQESGREAEAKNIDPRLVALKLSKTDTKNAIAMLEDLDG